MTKVLNQLIFYVVLIPIIGTLLVILFGFMYQPWLRLSKDFKSELYPPDVFIKKQSCILERTIVKGYLNVGIIEDKLYLSHTPPLNYFIHPLLINLDAITKIEPCFDFLLGGRCYKFLIGDPHITILILAQDLIEKLEEEYGDPIFSNKLGEFN